MLSPFCNKTASQSITTHQPTINKCMAPLLPILMHPHSMEATTLGVNRQKVLDNSQILFPSPCAPYLIFQDRISATSSKRLVLELRDGNSPDNKILLEEFGPDYFTAMLTETERLLSLRKNQELYLSPRVFELVDVG